MERIMRATENGKFKPVNISFQYFVNHGLEGCWTVLNFFRRRRYTILSFFANMVSAHFDGNW